MCYCLSGTASLLAIAGRFKPRSYCCRCDRGEAADEVRKVAVANTYGHAACRAQATQHHVEVLTALSSLGCEWLMLGDFNVALDEDPAVHCIAARGDVRALDECFEPQGALPGTGPGRLRRLDFGRGGDASHL